MARSQKSGSSTAEVEEQIAQIKSDVVELTRLLKTLADSKSEEVKATTMGEADHLLKCAREMTGAAEDRTREATEMLENYIKKKPTQSALIALMIGLFFGSISRR